MAKLSKCLTYYKWTIDAEELGFSRSNIAHVRKEWGQAGSQEFPGYSTRGLAGPLVTPRRFHTPEGSLLRISDVTDGHALVKNSSDSYVGLLDLQSQKVVLTVAEFPKRSASRDYLCCKSSGGSYLYFKPTVASSEIYVISRRGKTFVKRVAFERTNDNNILCNSFACHPSPDKEDIMACAVSDNEGTYPALYDVTSSKLTHLRKDRRISGHMIKFSRDGCFVIAVDSDEDDPGMRCANVVIMTSEDLSQLIVCPLIPTMATKDIDAIPSVCGFRFAVFGKKRLVKSQRPLAISCARQRCPIHVAVYRVTSPVTSLKRMCMKVILVRTDYTHLDQLPLPKAVISLLKSV